MKVLVLLLLGFSSSLCGQTRTETWMLPVEMEQGDWVAIFSEFSDATGSCKAGVVVAPKESFPNGGFGMFTPNERDMSCDNIVYCSADVDLSTNRFERKIVFEPVVPGKICLFGLSGEFLGEDAVSDYSHEEVVAVAKDLIEKYLREKGVEKPAAVDFEGRR